MSNDDLNQKVTERIQDQLLMILPEEEIRKRVDHVIDNFFSSNKDRDDRVEPSAFSRIIAKQLDEKINELVGNLFRSKQWAVALDSEMNLVLGSAIKTILGIDENALSTTVAKIVAARKASDMLALVGMHIMNKNLGQLGIDLQNALVQAASENYGAAINPTHPINNQNIGRGL
jgi:hypothetical protein